MLLFLSDLLDVVVVEVAIFHMVCCWWCCPCLSQYWCYSPDLTWCRCSHLSCCCPHILCCWSYCPAWCPGYIMMTVTTPVNKQNAWWSSCHSCQYCPSHMSCSWYCCHCPSRFLSDFVASSAAHFSFSRRFLYLSRLAEVCEVLTHSLMRDEGRWESPSSFSRIGKKAAGRSSTIFAYLISHHFLTYPENFVHRSSQVRSSDSISWEVCDATVATVFGRSLWNFQDFIKQWV